MTSVSFRIHEWFADHFRSIQYPPQRLMQLTKAPRAPFFKYEMPFAQRMLYLVIGVVAVVISTVVLLVIGIFTWGVLTK